MKKILSIFCFMAIITLCSCNKRVEHISYSDDETIAVMATDVTNTTATTQVTTSKTEKTTTTHVVKKEKPEDVLFNIKDKIEVYQQLKLTDLISDTNVELKNGNDIINTDKTGDFETIVNYTFDNEEYEHKIKYTVVDTTPPTILNSGWDPNITLGKKFELTDFVGYADNYDQIPVLTYEGNVDTSTCGTYPITATVTDSSGNSSKWDLSINVVEKQPVTIDDNSRLTFEDFKNRYSADNVRFGIDVSTWQGDIDFQAVKNAGCSFVIMRIGHYYDKITMDDYYLSNMKKAKESGLDVGIYIYTTANTEAEIRENAKWISEQLNGQKLDFPVAFDWENFANFQKYEMSIHDLNNYFKIFSEELEKSGHNAMLYSSKNFLNNFWYEHKEYPKWLAHYTDETDYAGEYDMWQMSCYGRIDGIAGDVDFNILYTDKKLG